MTETNVQWLKLKCTMTETIVYNDWNWCTMTETKVQWLKLKYNDWN
jgi:hypothetical protein